MLLTVNPALLIEEEQDEEIAEDDQQNVGKRPGETQEARFEMVSQALIQRPEQKHETQQKIGRSQLGFPTGVHDSPILSSDGKKRPGRFDLLYSLDSLDGGCG